MPHASTPSLIPALLLPWFAWRVYRRFHRNVGRQPLRASRLVVGVVVFALISGLLVFAVARSILLLESLGGGLGLGLMLGIVGLAFTRFETDPAGRKFYTPNTYIGIALTLLLAARVLYRIGVLYFSNDPAPTNPAAWQSPLTLVLLGLTAGYYIAYNAGVLLKR